jgi:hypothetical protein
MLKLPCWLDTVACELGGTNQLYALKIAPTTSREAPPKTSTIKMAAESQPGSPPRRRGLRWTTAESESKESEDGAVSAATGAAISTAGGTAGGGLGGSAAGFVGAGMVVGRTRAERRGDGAALGLAGVPETLGVVRGSAVDGLAGAAGRGRNSNFVPQRGQTRREAPLTASASNTCVQTGLGQGKVDDMAMNRLR